VLKEGVRRPAVVEHLQSLGAYLRWHGALSFDYILPADNRGPVYIDANPRLVEPMNAYLSGVNRPRILVPRCAERRALGPDHRRRRCARAVGHYWLD
jgi:hypothetical protein